MDSDGFRWILMEAGWFCGVLGDCKSFLEKLLGILCWDNSIIGAPAQGHKRARKTINCINRLETNIQIIGKTITFELKIDEKLNRKSIKFSVPLGIDFSSILMDFQWKMRPSWHQNGTQDRYCSETKKKPKN